MTFTIPVRFRPLVMIVEDKQALPGCEGRCLPLFAYECYQKVPMGKFLAWLMRVHQPRGRIWAMVQRDLGDDYGIRLWERERIKRHIGGRESIRKVCRKEKISRPRFQKAEWLTGIAFYDPSYPVLEYNELLSGNSEHSLIVEYPR